ncbi:TonB-dependent receptor [Paraglaciecola chathamensis]|uniref:TonB-dependent receptor n=1 Tax=Paraglaciecola agarilytica NO2 TaxID=1125747 RepID=A0ABQ0I364_9ALTE|nr:TonB-dependent receptor [Paraglaciecola agarilytica]GAC03743.1 hypothetical protein GAGA_0880 [Paraglaciecola agarilytica NO2]
MKTRNNYRKLTASAIGVLTALMQTSVNAAEGENESSLEKIVVTTQFKSQSVQDTPVAMTAMNAAMLEDRNMTDVSQVASSSPNVTLTAAGSAFGSATVASIRGVGQYDSSFAVEPGVGMYVDDVYHATLLGSIFDLLDLERVEVMRGPQGTLAGKNSLGGAIKLFSSKPDGTSGGYVEGVYGDFNRVDLRAAGEFTLVEDELFMRVSGSSKRRDGHITIKDYGCDNPNETLPDGSPFIRTNTSSSCNIGTEGGKDVHALRAMLRWVPSEDLEINIIADTTEDVSEAPGTVLTYTSLRADATPHSAMYKGQLVALTDRFIAKDFYTSYSTYNNPETDFSLSPVAKASVSGISTTVDWTINDNLVLKSITAWREVDSYHVQEDGSPLPIGLNSYKGKNKQITQELRLSGQALENTLDWTVGAYYYESDATQGGRKDLGFLNLGPFGLGLFFVDDDIITADSKSVFAHGIYALTDKLNVSAGIRYTEESKSYTFGRLTPEGEVHPVLGALHGVTPPAYEGDQVDYRLVFDYHLSDNLMTYVQYSTGFKGGGVNSRPSFAFHAVPFEPETLDAYEVGFKGDLLDNTLRLNLSAFFNNYQDIQVTLSDCSHLNVDEIPGGNACTLQANAGEAEIKGLEAEVTWYPTDDLIIDFSASTLDFKYTDVAISTGLSNTDITPYTPEVQASLGMQYYFELKSGTLTPRIDVNYRSEFYTDGKNKPTNEIDGLTMINARLTWKSNDDLWQAALSVTNLADKEYYRSSMDLTTNYGTVHSNPGRPREVAISIKRNFY